MEIPWSRVTALNGDVFFSHRLHTRVGEVECRECHPLIPTLDRPLASGPVHMAMETCIACHERRGVSTDCVRCHR